MDALNRFTLLMLGYNSQEIDDMHYSDVQLIVTLYPLYQKQLLDRVSLAVNKGVFGGQ